MNYELSHKDKYEKLNEYNVLKREFDNYFRSNYFIRLQFHIVRKDDGSGGIEQEELWPLLHNINNTFKESGIFFYHPYEVNEILETGFYVLTNSSIPWWLDDGTMISVDELDSIHVAYAIPNVIDIFIVNTWEYNNNVYSCGHSSPTWNDLQGIIIADSCPSDTGLDDTMQHELGHYFDLFHTHQVTNSSDSTEFGVYGSEYVNGDSCEFRGDGICDTPADPNLTSLTDGSCNYLSDSTEVDNHGDEYDGEVCLAYPPCENYGGPDTRNMMSSTPDNCREHFTYQQNEKITLIALSARSDYLMDIDPNNDGIINIIDLVLIANMLLANEYSPIADINEDGELNILDIIIYVNIILST